MKTLLDPKHPSDHWEMIKAALRARGSSLSAVARDLGVTRMAVHHVHHKPYPAVESAIASVLGVDPQELWPDRYQPSGEPKRKRPNAPMARPEFRKSRKVKVSSCVSQRVAGGGL